MSYEVFHRESPDILVAGSAVRSYSVMLEPTRLDIKAVDQNGQQIAHFDFRGLDFTNKKVNTNEAFSGVFRIGNDVLEFKGIYCSMESRVHINGVEQSTQEISDQLKSVLEQIQSHLQDAFRTIKLDDMTHDPLRLPPNQSRVMNTICYIAGIGTGFWPIGTALFGPTAVGCVVLYATGSL